MKRATLLTLICFFAVSGIGLAKGPKGPCGMGELKLPHGKWWQLPEVAEKLDLTREEQQKLDDLLVQNQRHLIDLKTDVQKERLQLEVILDQQNFDESACMDRFKKFQYARTNLANERFKFLVEVRKLLGSDRYRKLKTEFHDRQINRMKEHHRPKGCFKGAGVNR